MPSPSSTSVVTALGTSILVAQLWRWYQRVRTLPPGPKKLPLIDNLFNMPNGLDWVEFAKIGKSCGSDIIHFGALGTSIIVINSQRVAQDLLDKRSSIYSSRAHSIMLNELAGWDFLFGMYPYGTKWREERRIFTKYFGSALKDDYSWEIRYARRLLFNLLQEPEHFMEHISHTVGPLLISKVYGLPVLPKNDPYVALADTGARTFGQGLLGTWLVDVFPILRHVPAWFPGASFQKFAAKSKEISSASRNKPFEAVEQMMKSGSYQPSFVTLGLEDCASAQDRAETVEALKNIASQAYLAGTDTTTAVLGTFFLAMTLYPEVQKKAQAELDIALQGKLPDPESIQFLPYLNALVLELYRWKVVTPIGIPHLVTADDTYEGYHIPKDSIVIANQWAMTYDENVYPEPATFRPERFLKDNKLDVEAKSPFELAFGFGRRSCPGRHIAHSMIMLTAASVLSTFDIKKQRDSSGQEIVPPGEYFLGVSCLPLPFPCAISPRSSASAELVRSWGGLGE